MKDKSNYHGIKDLDDGKTFIRVILDYSGIAKIYICQGDSYIFSHHKRIGRSQTNNKIFSDAMKDIYENENNED